MLDIGRAQQSATGNTTKLLGDHWRLLSIKGIGILLDQVDNVRIQLLGIKRHSLEALGINGL
jgi:hypothetical protein